VANPQLKNGYIKIATEIMEALIKYRIPGEQMQCLLFIIRKTYGWNKKEDAIALSQFTEATKMSKQAVCRALKNLANKNIVIKKDNAVTTTYQFNKKYKTWKPLSKKITLSKKIISVIKKDNLALSKKRHTIDTNTIYTTKEKKRAFNQKEFDTYPKKVAKKEALTRWQKLIKSNELPELPEILKAINNQVAWRNNSNGDFRPEWKHPAVWLNKGCWDDEIDLSKPKDNSYIDIYGDD